MRREEMFALLRELKMVFDIVRLVDASATTQFWLDEAGEIREEPYQCYAVWKKSGRCEDCISARALRQKNKQVKFEFVDQNIYYVISMYVEVDGMPYALEMVSQVTSETFFGAYGKNEFVESITNYREKLYLDPLTGAYNRRYYEEMLRDLPGLCAVAMIDVDEFKRINDTFGHPAGDQALKAIVKAITSYTRNSDAVVRYGGDEFLIVFQEITRDSFAKRLEMIREAVSRIVLEGYTALHLTVSIGGRYCGKEASDAVREADVLLYQAKLNKNNVQMQ